MTLKHYLAATLIAFMPLPILAEETEAAQSDVSTYEMLNLFGDVFERIRRDYVEEPKDANLIEAAINGMLTSLDPHSSYLNEKSFKEMQVQTKGEFGGLGIEVTMENGLVKVVSPIDDTPAFKAGVKAGDFISQIDGESVMGMTLSDAVEKMRGRIGSKIVVTMLREGMPEPFDLEIIRDLIQIKSTRARAEEDVAYVRIVQFSENTYESLTANLDEQLKKIGPKTKGVVLDLRNNPGGLLDQAIAVSDAFLDRGEIVSTRERDPANTKRYSARKGDLIDGLPLVVLINEGSASASEIVAGALKDHKRAVILGTKSFGKGSVQTVIPLRNHGAIRLTTARYYTPSGTSIQATGIEPDIMVEQAKIEKIQTAENSGRRSEASLPGHLNNDQQKENVLKLPEKKPEGSTAAPLGNLTDKEGAAADVDYQLSRALDLIRALSIYNQVIHNDAG